MTAAFPPSPRPGACKNQNSKNCFGISLLRAVVKKLETIHSKSIKPILIAPCGMNCGLCIAYIRDKNTCPGCIVDDVHKPRTRADCSIKNCIKIKTGKFRFCFDCDDFACHLLKHLDKRYRTKYSMSMIDNLEHIKRFGIRDFIRQQKKKWTCRNCGHILSVHRENCISCGYKWR
jgi:hypothetical protein